MSDARDDRMHKLREQQKQEQQLDQNTAFIADRYPPLWRRLFENLQKEGFDQAQSMELLKTYILTSGQVRP